MLKCTSNLYAFDAQSIACTHILRFSMHVPLLDTGLSTNLHLFFCRLEMKIVVLSREASAKVSIKVKATILNSFISD